MAKPDCKTILVVDDDVSVTEYLSAAIRSAGHTIELAYDGEEALEAFERSQPDLVLLDALIPKKDGFEVCRAIKARSRSTPVVMMSGIYTKRSYRQDALKSAGAVEYLLKPFGISELLRVLQDHLGVKASGGKALEDGEILRHMGASSDVEQGLRRFFQGGEGKLGEGTSFTQKPVALVLRDLYLRRRTGLLLLRNDKWTSIFYFQRGEIVFVRSNDVSLRLDRVLVKMNKLDDDQYERAQDLFKAHRGKRRMGEILTGMKIISQDDLAEALRFQLQLLVARVFQWKSGTSYFVQGPLPEKVDPVGEIDTRALLFTGVRNMRDIPTLRRHLPSDHTVLRRSQDHAATADAVGLTAFERQILSVVDGTKTVRQVRSMGQLANVQIDALLFAFLCTGLLNEDKATSALLQPARSEPAQPAKRRAFKGDLATRPMGQLLRTLHKSRKTGVLTIESGGVRKWVQVERGEVIFAGSDDPEDRIGRVLVRADLIGEAELDEALQATSHREGKRIGRVLVDAGHITLEELYWAVVFQVQRIVVSMFAEPSGSYLFREGPLPTRERIILELDTINLILEGIRSMPEEALRPHLPDPASRVRRLDDWEKATGDLGLSATETSLLEAIRGEVRCGDIMEGGPDGDLEFQRAVYALTCVGLLEVIAPSETEVAVEEEEIALAAGGAPAGAVSHPGPRPGPVGKAPIPFRKEPVAVEEESQGGEEPVPRFLYDELLAERRELEDQILEQFSESCDLKARLDQAAAGLREILTGSKKKLRRKELEEVLAILEPEEG